MPGFQYIGSCGLEFANELWEFAISRTKPSCRLVNMNAGNDSPGDHSDGCQHVGGRWIARQIELAWLKAMRLSPGGHCWYYYPAILSSLSHHQNSFEYQVLVDIIYGYLIFKSFAITWLKGSQHLSTGDVTDLWRYMASPGSDDSDSAIVVWRVHIIIGELDHQWFEWWFVQCSAPSHVVKQVISYCHQMETCSSLPAFCAGNLTVTGEPTVEQTMETPVIMTSL